MKLETLKKYAMDAVRATPDGVVIAAFATSLVVLAVTIADVMRPVSVTITQDAWTCTQASTSGLSAVCTQYERRKTK